MGGHTYRARVTSDIEARVTVNGVIRGVTPASVTVREGDRIEVSREGYQSQRVIVDPVGGDERAYAFKMMRPNEYAFRQAAAEVSLANGMVLRKFPPVHIRLRPANAQAPTIEKELTRPFYMGLREVAYQEYLVFDSQPIPRGLSPGHPVTNLTWAEAARYCNWLSRQEGFQPVYEFDSSGELRRVATGSLGYRLPTEAEWEAVAGHDFARKRAVGPFPWGRAASIPRAFGNFAGREIDGRGRGNFLFDHVDNHTATAPVGSYPANFNGLYDLAGQCRRMGHGLPCTAPPSDGTATGRPIGAGEGHRPPGQRVELPLRQVDHAGHRSPHLCGRQKRLRRLPHSPVDLLMLRLKAFCLAFVLLAAAAPVVVPAVASSAPENVVREPNAPPPRQPDTVRRSASSQAGAAVEETEPKTPVEAAGPETTEPVDTGPAQAEPAEIEPADSHRDAEFHKSQCKCQPSPGHLIHSAPW